MGSFFLHTAAHDFIYNQYPEIYNKTSQKVKDAVKSSGLDRRRYSVWLYKVAESQISGVVETVKKMPLYDFIDILGYLSSKDKFNDEMMKR